MIADSNVLSIFKDKKYFLPTETLPEQMNARVVDYISLAEEESIRSYWRDKFYWAMDDRCFFPSSPCVLNAGHPTNPNQLSSCFIVPIEDSMNGIMDALKWQATITKNVGGTGFSFSKLRPSGDPVSGMDGIAGGPVCFMRVFNANTEAVKKGRKRGANMASLHIWHPSIEEFIDCKKDLKEFNNFNITVGITNDFMEVLESSGKCSLVFNDKVYKSVDAQYLWDKIINNAWLTGEPGIEFLDRMNQDNPVPHLGEITSGNPCHEYVFTPWGSCNLGSIKLSACVTDAGEFDWEMFAELVYLGVRFIDDMITMNQLPLPQLQDMAERTRPVGLGVMDLAGALIKMGIPYDSKKGLAFSSKVSKFMRQKAEEASMALAEEKGVFPEWEKSTWGQKGIKMRNSTLLSIAPTGTISIITGCSSGGIEPIYAIGYARRVESMNDTIMTFFDALFEKIAKDRGFYSQELVDKVVQTGSCQGIKEVPKDVQALFKTANEIPPEQHVRMQAAWQENVDLSLAKTINLPATATREEISDIYKLAYKLGIKGVTVYRDGCRDNVLKAGSGKTYTPVLPAMEDWVSGARIKRKTGCGSIWVALYTDGDGKLREIFTSPSKKSGGCQATIEALSRMVSLSLRANMDPETICDQLRTPYCKNSWDKTGFRSCAAVMADTIEGFLQKANEKTSLVTKQPAADIIEEAVGDTVCPECHSKLDMAEGCKTCRHCNWSGC